MDSLQHVVNNIQTLSMGSDGDLKRLKDLFRHEQDTLKANVAHIDQALAQLSPAQHTLGVAYLLEYQFRSASLLTEGDDVAKRRQKAASTFTDPRATVDFVGTFLRVADEVQAKKAHAAMYTVCKNYAQMAIDDGQQAMLRSLTPLRCAVEKLRPNPETLTAAHADYVKVCWSCKAYHLGARLLDQPIFDISMTTSNCAHMTPQCFLSYYYYGALIRLGMKQDTKALQMLLVALTTPASCLSPIQGDAYKKYALVSLKVHGEANVAPSYASHIVMRYAKDQRYNYYTFDIAEAFKAGDLAALNKVVEDKATQLESDQNMGLVKQVVQSMQRHKVRTLTKTYMTLSLPEIVKHLGLEEDKTGEVEELLFDMIGSGEINARIDQATGNVSFEDDDGEMDADMVAELQDKLGHIMELAGRISVFEQEVVSSEAYIWKTATIEANRAGGGMAGYDFMDM